MTAQQLTRMIDKRSLQIWEHVRDNQTSLDSDWAICKIREMVIAGFKEVYRDLMRTRRELAAVKAELKQLKHEQEQTAKR